MTGNDTSKFPIDEAILDYLSKKAATDQTEKLAFAKISSKIETSVEQAQNSINRLCEKHLIRKVSWQGKVVFELTPKGKSSIDALAKARTDLITRQLQDAIHLERKAKLRSNVINKVKSIADEWQNYQVPDRSLIDETKREAVRLLGATKEIECKRPLCHKNPQNYDQEYFKYKTQIENLSEKNKNVNKIVNNYAKTKNAQISISAGIEKINKTISKYEPIAEATAQISQLKTALGKLRSIQSQLENYQNDELSQLEELNTKLTENSRTLDILKKPTHEFMPVKKSFAENATWYSEGQIKYENKTSGYLSEEKCSKCGAKRKPKPVNIG
jgi:predicted transcriptional regulator